MFVNCFFLLYYYHATYLIILLFPQLLNLSFVIDASMSSFHGPYMHITMVTYEKNFSSLFKREPLFRVQSVSSFKILYNIL